MRRKEVLGLKRSLCPSALPRLVVQVLIHSKTLFMKRTATDPVTGLVVGVVSCDPIKLVVWEEDTLEPFVPPKGCQKRG